MVVQTLGHLRAFRVSSGWVFSSRLLVLQVLLVQAISEVVMPRRTERRRKMTPSEAVRNFVGFAKDIFGVGDGEYELRNHDGMGFCWGSATLAGFSSGFISKFRLTETPGGNGP